MSAMDDYNDLIKSRQMLQMAKSQGLQDESGAVGEGVGSSATGQVDPNDPVAQKLAANKAAASKGSGLQEAAALAAPAAAVPNPYVQGAVLGLQAVSMVDAAKRQTEQAKIDAYNNRLLAMRAATRNLFE